MTGRYRLPFAAALSAGAIALAGCSPDAVVTTNAPSASTTVTSTIVPPSQATNDHFAFWRTFRASEPLDVTNDAVIPSPFAPAVRTTRIDVGHYVTDLVGMSDNWHRGSKEIVITTTYGSTTAQCSSDGWFGFSTKDEMEVRTDCNDMRTGQRADATFAALVVGNGSLASPSAFAIANHPGAASYTPDTSSSYTTGTGAMLIERIGVGDWFVHLGTGNPQGSMYLVSSLDEHAVCTISEWKNFGIRVRCFDGNGALVDATYKILQIAWGRGFFQFAYAWADQRSLTTPYVPNRSFSTRGPVTATRTSAGDYQVEFAGLQNPNRLPENVQVTAFSGVYSACTVVSKTDSTTGRLVRVQCRDAAGGLADSRFNIVLIT